MALATTEDVEVRLERELTEAEVPRVEAMLEDASAAVIGYCNRDPEDTTPFGDPVPDAVVGVVAKMVVRGMNAGQQLVGGIVDQQNAGPFSVHYSAGASSGDMWLTAGDKLALKPYRISMRSVPLGGVRTGA